MNAVHQLAPLGPEDLQLVSRLIDLLITAPRRVRDEALRRLSAIPETHQETRERITAVCAFMKRASDAE